MELFAFQVLDVDGNGRTDTVAMIDDDDAPSADDDAPSADDDAPSADDDAPSADDVWYGMALFKSALLMIIYSIFLFQPPLYKELI